MIDEKDIQLELLNEINNICIQNNLNYILIGTNGLNAFINHSIKNGLLSVSIAMTLGDINRFINIVKKQNNPNRYVERINTQRKNHWHVNYGNKNTAYFNILKLDNAKYHGINIKLYPIKGLKLNKKAQNISKLNNINKIFNKFFKSNSTESKISNKTYINEWKDIQKFTVVKIINTKIKAKTLNELIRYDVDNLQLSLPKNASEFFREIFGDNFKNREIKHTNVGHHYILNTEIGYQQIINESQELIAEVNSINEELKLKSSEVEKDREIINNLWNLILMTNKQIEFTKYFDEHIENLLTFDLSDEKEFSLVYQELKPVIYTLKKYSKFEMTFNINPETDNLIEKVLLIKGDEKLVNKIKNLQNKEFFIE